MSKKLTLEDFLEYVLIIIIAMICSMFGNFINTITDGKPDTYVSILAGLPGLLILMGIAVAGLTLNAFVPKIPSVIWITILGILLAMPMSPTGAFVSAQVGKIGLLPATTPILAYAGVSIGKDWIAFKKIGLKGILVSIFVMIGTYIGSAVIAQLILTMQGVL